MFTYKGILNKKNVLLMTIQHRLFNSN